MNIQLLNRTYAPHDKWMYLGMKHLSKLEEVRKLLLKLCERHSQQNDFVIIEQIADVMVHELKMQKLTGLGDTYLGHPISTILDFRTFKQL